MSVKAVNFRCRCRSSLYQMANGEYQARRHSIFRVDVTTALKTPSHGNFYYAFRLYDSRSGTPVAFPWGNDVSTDVSKWKPHFEVKPRGVKDAKWLTIPNLAHTVDPWVCVPFSSFKSPADDCKEFWVRIRMCSSFLPKNSRSRRKGSPFQLRVEVVDQAEYEAPWTTRQIEWMPASSSSMSPALRIVDGSRVSTVPQVSEEFSSESGVEVDVVGIDLAGAELTALPINLLDAYNAQPVDPTYEAHPSNMAALLCSPKDEISLHSSDLLSCQELDVYDGVSSDWDAATLPITDSDFSSQHSDLFLGPPESMNFNLPLPLSIPTPVL